MGNVAINRLGRIGRAALKIILDAPELNLVAANGVATADNLAYLCTRNGVVGRSFGQARVSPEPRNGCARLARRLHYSRGLVGRHPRRVLGQVRPSQSAS